MSAVPREVEGALAAKEAAEGDSAVINIKVHPDFIPRDIDLAIEETERFLQALDPDGFAKRGFTFQTFADSKEAKKGDGGKLARVIHGKLHRNLRPQSEPQPAPPPPCTELLNLNYQGAGVFVAVNACDGRGRKAENVTAVRALFLDLDIGGEDGQRRLARVREKDPRPSIIVESSPGKFHVYWLVTGCPLDEFPRMQAALAEEYGGDKSVKDLPRVMRLPGFIHRKGEPFRTRLIECSGERYEFARVAFGLGLMSGPQVVAEGGRHNHILQMAASLLARNIPLEEAWTEIERICREECDPPYDTPEDLDDARKCLEWAYGKPPGTSAEQRAAEITGRRVGDKPVEIYQASEPDAMARLFDQYLVGTGRVFRQGDVLSQWDDKMTELRPLNADGLRIFLAGLARWQKFNAQNELRNTSIPVDATRAFLKHPDLWTAPVIDGIVQCPVLLPDGRVAMRGGYDPETRLMLLDAPQGLRDFGVDREGQVEALRFLMAPFREVEFADAVSRAVHLAALLTVVQRPVLDTAPAFAWSAPRPGVGKTMLAKCAFWLTGRMPGINVLPRSEEELGKVIVAAIRGGRQAILFDNISHEVGTDTLNGLITSGSYNGRLLGQSQQVEGAFRASLLMTGNNLTLRDDMTRRVMVCAIECGEEQPERRHYAFDPEEMIRADWGSYRAAAVTLLDGKGDEAGAGAGAGAGSFGSFEQWNRMVRGRILRLIDSGIAAEAVVELADPVLSIDQSRENDPVLAQLRAFLTLAHGVFGDEPINTARLISHAELFSSRDQDSTQLAEVIREIAWVNGRPDNYRMAHFLRRYRDRWEGGLRIVKLRLKTDGVAHYRIEKQR